MTVHYTYHLGNAHKSQMAAPNLNNGGNVKIEFRYKKAKMMFNATL